MALSNYWRSRAAIALLKLAGVERIGAVDRLTYSGLPSIPGMAPVMAPETIRQAIDALYDFQDARMPSAVFLDLIALIEERVVSRLSTLLLPTDGTLGAIQKRIESALENLDERHTRALDEIRERRNCMVHDHGIAGTKLVTALSLLMGPTRSMVPSATLGVAVVVDGAYLTYCQHVLAQYSDALG